MARAGRHGLRAGLAGIWNCRPHAVPRPPGGTARRGAAPWALPLACVAWVGAHAAPAWAQTVQPDPWLACAEAATAAELDAGLPPGLLLAIGKVESGRAGPGGVVPWPYAVNVAGRGMLAADGAAAIAQVRAAQAAGQRSVDVGCFQVSLLHHPGAFDSLEAGFDPVRNARYAAGFLAALRAGAPSWEAAAGRYHSMTPELAGPYAAQVMAAWAGVPYAAALPVMRIARQVVLQRGVMVYTPGAAAPTPPFRGLFGSAARLPVVYRPGPSR